MSLYILVGLIKVRELRGHGFSAEEILITSKEEDGMFIYSELNMLMMIQVRNLLNLIEWTLPRRVMNGLCDHDANFCSP